MKTDYKELLSAYRPDTADQNDPLFAQALEQLEHDVELKEWFDEQKDMDAEIRAALLTDDAPETLLEDVLEFGAEVKKKNRKIIRFFQPAQLMAIAACIALVGIFAFKDSIINNQIIGYHSALSKVEQKETFRDAMSLWVADTFIVLDHFAEEPAQLVNYLADAGSPVFDAIPANLEQLPTLGCKSFKWKDQAVSLICFHSQEGKIVHLFVLSPSNEPTEAIDQMHQLQFLHDLPSKGWYDENSNKQHMLVGSARDVSLDQFNTQMI